MNLFPRGPQASRSWPSFTWLLGAAPVLLAVAGTAIAGSLSIPHNDDWSYFKTARILAETGDLHLQGWGAVSLVGQVYLVYPVIRIFGSNPAVLNLSMALISIVGLGGAYSVYRHFGSTRTALLGTLVTSLFPGYLLLSTSFMSDVPAFAAMTLCMAAGLRTLEHRSLLWFWTTLALGAVGVTVGEQAIAAPIALLLVWALLPAQDTSPKRPRRIALGGGVAFTVFVVAFMWWRMSLPAADNPSMSKIQLRYVFGGVVSAFPVLGLALPVFVKVGEANGSYAAGSAGRGGLIQADLGR